MRFLFIFIFVAVVVLLGVILWIGWMLIHATIRVTHDFPTVVKKNIWVLFPQALSSGEDVLYYETIVAVAMESACPVLINGSNGMDKLGKSRVWSGRKDLIEKLERRGLKSFVVLPAGYNTYEEMCHLLRWLQDNFPQGGRVLIISLPHRALRTMLTFLKARHELHMQQHLAWIGVPSGIPWFKKSKGSQGSDHGELYRHIWPELKRIFWHQGLTYLPYLPKLFEYWRERERRVSTM